jgi:long-subunit fatty acid transport protein
LGIGVHFSKLNVSSTSYWEEQFIGANIIGGLVYQERLTTSGSGISATLGMIYKMNSNLRVAFSLQTPTYFDQMNERMDGALSPRVFGIPSFDAQGKPIVITKVGPVKLTPNEFSYQLTTPLKISGGAAYLIGKKALISLDVEYVNYPGMKVSSAELSPTDNVNFQNKYNGQTQKNFQAGMNIKAGTEIRLTPSFSLRGGLASFGNSYSATFDSIDRTVLQFSGGIGYRTNQFYIDLTGYQRTGKDAFTPYTLKNTADYSSATLTLTQSQVLLGLGIYF